MNKALCDFTRYVTDFYDGNLTYKDIYLPGFETLLQQAEKEENKTKMLKELTPWLKLYITADERMMEKEYFFREIVQYIVDHTTNSWQYIDIDIYDITMRWAESFDRHGIDNIKPYHQVIKWMIEAGFVEQDMEKGLWKRVCDELRVAEQYTTRNRGMLFCFLAGCIQFFHSGRAPEDVMQLSDRLAADWSTMSEVFAVLIHRVVGTKVSNFASLANNPIVRTSDHHHIYMIYNALKLHIDDLSHIDTRRHLGEMADVKSEAYQTRYAKAHTQLEKNLLKMEKIMQTTPQDHDLDDICGLIFPSVSKILKAEQVEDYLQLKKQRDEAWRQSEAYRQAVEEMEHELGKEMIGLNEIAKCILQYPTYDKQREAFDKINSVLVGTKWVDKAQEVLQTMLERLREKEACSNDALTYNIDHVDKVSINHVHDNKEVNL